jgi:hypothetical protein
MTHEQKLNMILSGLLSRQPKRLEDKTDDKRLTFDFLCNILFENEEMLGWEIEFLQNRLLSDNYIKFIEIDNVQLPDITQEGIKFIQHGGYEEQYRTLQIDKEIKKETLKELHRNKLALVLSVISIMIAFVSLLATFLK